MNNQQQNFDFWVFDFEVFKYDWTSIWHNPMTGEWKTIRNDRPGLIDFLNENMHKAIFIGFNSNRYDINIIKAIYGGLDPYALSQWIIAEGKSAYLFPGMKTVYGLPIITFDLKNDAIKRFNMALSLKEYEAYIGSNIHESSIDFNIDRKLTDEEMMLTEGYCTSDVANATIMLNEPTQINQLETMLSLCSLLPGEPLHKKLHRTVAQLSAKILDTVKVNYGDDDVYVMPENIKIQNQEVIDFFTKQPLTPTMKMTVNMYGVEFELGLGGMHAAIPKYTRSGRMLNMDVASYYPSMIIQYNYQPRGIKRPEAYEDVYKQRLAYKKAGNKLADALKLVLNIVYGAADNQYSELFDPRMRRAIAITGQLLLWDLIEKLAPYGEFVNVNTDGLMINPYDLTQEPEIMAICHEWMGRARMVLEFDWYKKVVQADVNNYILVTEDDKVKVKGTMVKFYGKEKSNYNRQVRITHDAVVELLVNGINPRETIMNCKDVLDLQYIAKASGLYMKTYSGPANIMEALAKGNTEGIDYSLVKEEQKVSRLYPTLNGDGVTLRKWRTVTKNEKEEKEQFTKFTNAPDNAYVINDEVRRINTPELFDKFVKDINLDWEYYVKEAWSDVEKMIGIERCKALKEAFGEA